MPNMLGKRYQCEKCGTEVLCNKAGPGKLECCETEMKIKEAKPLPSSD
jgi:Desulfoferrodoxin, N-terminal domain